MDYVLEPHLIPLLSVLENRCSSSCHGVASRDFKRKVSHEPYSLALYYALDDKTGEIKRDIQSIHDLKERLKRFVDLEDLTHSPLLMYPLSEIAGGKSHQAAEVFFSKLDPDYLTILSWIEGEFETKNPKERTRSQKFFATNVLPVLVRKGCFLSSCHGPNTFNDFKLTPPQNHNPLHFSEAAITKNYKASRGEVTSLIHFNGDVSLSRLLAKVLPLEDGGIPHKGGNTQFFFNQQEADAITLNQWMEMEKQETLEAQGLLNTGKLKGFIYLSQKRGSQGLVLSAPPFSETKIYFVPVEANEVLFHKKQDITSAIGIPPHTQIQAIDIHFDAQKVLINLRSRTTGFSIYEFALNSSGEPVKQSLKLRLASPSKDIHFLDPIYGSRPGEIVFSSNQAGKKTRLLQHKIPAKTTLLSNHKILVHKNFKLIKPIKSVTLIANQQPLITLTPNSQQTNESGLVLEFFQKLPDQWHSPHLLLLDMDEDHIGDGYDLYSHTDKSTNYHRISFGGATERFPSLRSTGEVFFTSLRNHGTQAGIPIFNAAIYRLFPGGWDYHVHGGNRSDVPVYTHSRELPGGFEIRLGLDSHNLSLGGKLFFVEHGFGVNIEPNNPYNQFPVVDTQNLRQESISQQRFLHSVIPMPKEYDSWLFRDPFPLPDNSVLAAYSLDSHQPANYDLIRIYPESSICQPHCTEARIKRVEFLKPLNSEDMDEIMLRPVTTRHMPNKEVPHKITAFDDKASSEVHCYDYTLLESFLTDFTPNHPRKFKDDEIRFVRIVTQKNPGVFPPLLQAYEEIPLKADRSFAATVPPHTPLIFQGLNQDKMAVHQMSRFTFTQPTEKLTFSIPRSIYPLRCAGCHAPLSGERGKTFAPPDLVTQASLVLANWDPIMSKPIQPPGSHEQKPYTVSFVKDIAPIIKNTCLACHDQGKNPDFSGVKTGHPKQAYDALMVHEPHNPHKGKYIDYFGSLSSKSSLFNILKDQSRCASTSLSYEDWLNLIRFVDLGSKYETGESQ